jgi:SHS2 domain-containing protein
MSWWILPTTADVGLVVFSSSLPRLCEEMVYGLQSILIAEDSSLDGLVRSTSTWRVEATPDREDLTLVRWLEEVLYQCEVEQRFLVDCQIHIGAELEAQVSWVAAAEVEREIEVKAVTRHQLECRYVDSGEVAIGSEGIPDFGGPGWIARVIFDI